MFRVAPGQEMRMPPKVAESIADVRESIAQARVAGQTIGFVPTMGALHAGHAALVERAKRECDYVVVSIFVNPTQFGPGEDYSRYPRTFDSDLVLCERAGAKLIFVPDRDTIYPSNFGSTYVDVSSVSDVLEGASRPGHFRGVATVVLKLFGIVTPDRAYFGQKDFQQQLILRRMVDDLNVPVSMVTVPTVREADGLAMSSRNRYLNAEERQAARVLSLALGEARAAVKGGETSANRVRQILTSTVKSERLATLDYAEVADAATLEPLTDLVRGREAVALLVARVGPARLIDNAILTD
jgi:pantoate--beta-alanine ligase